MTRLLIALCAAVSVASCGTPCTLIGCVDTIEFAFTDATQGEVTDGTVARVCVDGACLDHTIGSGASYDAGTRTLQVWQGEPAALTGKVTLTISRDGSERLRREWADVTFVTFEPNGQACGPTCHRAGPLTVE